MLTLQSNCFLSKAPQEKAAVVLLGGAAPKTEELLQYIKDAPYLAAADGGAALALQAGTAPDLLIGDFDSLSPEEQSRCQTAGAEILTLPVMKDLTDGEFLLQTLAKRGFKKLLVLGALGGRPDQELANIFCAEQLAKQGVYCLLAHDNALLLPLYAEEQELHLDLLGFAGKTASLLSLSASCAHIILNGFLYPLDGPLRRCQTLGISNIIQKEAAAIRLTSGSLLTVIDL